MTMIPSLLKNKVIKMHYIHKTAMFLALVLCLSACGNPTSETYMISPIPVQRYSAGVETYQNGAIYQAYDNDAQATYFLEYETLQSVPLCNKPNCRHTSDSCLAYSCAEFSVPLVYQNQVFWFKTTSNIVDAPDGKHTDYQFHTILYCADLREGEIEIFAEIPDVSMGSAVEAVLVEQMLYIIGCDQAYQSTDGTWIEIANAGDQYLYAIDLYTAEVKNYGLINDAPTAHYNWDLDAGSMYYEVRMNGVYQDRLYLSYRYVDQASEIENFLKTIDYSDPNWNWNGAETEIPWHRVTKCLNLKTMELEDSDLPMPEIVGDDYYVYYADGKFHVMDQEGNIITSSDLVMDSWVGYTVVNGKLWHGRQNLCFDPKTGEDIPLAEKYQEKDITVLDLYEGEYIIQYLDENYAYVFESVSEEELLGT